MTERMKAMPRDASWVNNPDTSSPKKYHVVNHNERPACGTRVVLNDDMAMWADQVPVIHRCMRKGCRGKWPCQ